ncbi:hypothetical protein [Variovorax sp. SRS16]|uniref:hypothetical protein n=1 Tax=Variovorax sp. SRS16 TaxID=282217 RepID=UPI0013A5A02E|nr:hypothetical protein [Variovorax sp. SRS16]
MESASNATSPILDALKQRFPGIPAGPGASLPASRPSNAIYLAIGPAALRAALVARVTEPLLALFASRQSFEAVLKEAQKYSGMKVSAIYAEASPDAQFELIAAIYQRRVSVGVMLSEFGASLASTLERAAEKSRLDLLLYRVERSGNVVRALAALSDAAAVLAIPDPAIFSSDNLRGILESTYRRGQAVIGFTPALVNAGILATAYATVEDVLDQLPQILSEFEQGRIPEPRYPSYWRVSINESVARSLNLVLSDEVKALARKKGRS